MIVNYWAVLVCGVAAMAIGALWYGPLLGKHWMKEMGMNKLSGEELAKMKKDANKNYPQQFIGALLMAYVLSVVLVAFKASNVAMGLQVAFWLWLGFIVPVKYGDKLWGGKSAKLFFIDAFHYLVNVLIMAAILSAWK